MQTHLTILSPILLTAGIVAASSAVADSFTEALSNGKTSGDFRLRFEDVDQDNALKDGTALTLRSRLAYTTGEFQRFSAKVEVEDNRVVAGQDDYSVPNFGIAGNGHNVGEYSVIADPEVTEVDQGYLQYKDGGVTAKLGRQVIAYDNHRFIGHVGWRQDRQVFDAFTLNYKPSETVTVNYGYINEREGIFAEERDIDSKDHLFNITYQAKIGALTGYAYLLETDSSAPDVSIDTYGIRLTGKKSIEDLPLLYTAEYASQEWSMQGSSNKRYADYLFAEIGVVLSGVTVKLGYEVLGSDDGLYGFATPLATLHKFNGWSDQFLGTSNLGLVDAMVTVTGKIAGGTVTVIYHDFSPDKDSATVDDLGSEWNAVYAKKFGKNYSAGIKYANYSAGDAAAGKVDTDKLWVWGALTF